MRWRLLILMLLVLRITWSQEREFLTYTTLDGLNNGTINDIEQDSLGRLWLATWDGLMRFDGYGAVNYNPNPGNIHSLPSRKCTNLKIDASHNLWVSTARGVCRYDTRLDRFETYAIEGLPESSPVRDKLVEFRNIRLIRSAGHLFSLPPNQPERKEFRRMKVQRIDDVFEERIVRYMVAQGNDLYISFRRRVSEDKYVSEIYKIRAMNDSIIRIDTHPEFEVPGNIFDMNVSSGKLFIATDFGLYSSTLSEHNVELIEQTKGMKISTIQPCRDGGLWFGTDLHGLFSYDIFDGSLESYTHDPNRVNTLLGNNIFSLYEDFSGMLVIGHGGEGLSMINLNEKDFHTFRYNPQDAYSLQDNTVMCFNECKDGALIGTRNGGLFKMTEGASPGKAKFENIPFPESFYSEVVAPAVWSIARESEQLFWIGTVFGLIRAEYSSGLWKFEKYFGNTTFRSVFLDDSNNLWLGSYNGVYLIPYSNRKHMDALVFKNSDPSNNFIPGKVFTSFYLDSKDNFWLGTENSGIIRLSTKYRETLSALNKGEQVVFDFQQVNSAEVKYRQIEVNSFYEHLDGTIWIGTKGDGIKIYHPLSESFSEMGIDDGLPGKNIFGIIRGYLGNLWLSTNNGIASYNNASNEIRTYSPADGIQGNVFMVNAYFMDSKQRMFFGGRNGFTVFEADLITDNLVLPKFHFKGLNINGKDVGIGDTLNRKVILPSALPTLTSVTLPYKERSFNVQFSAIHFQYPDENKIEYHLEGFSQLPTTIDANLKQIVFTNLKEGTYTLNVKVGNSDDVWTNNFESLDIVILPPWYRTKIAIIVFTLLLLSIVFFLVRLLLKRQALEHELRIEKIEKSNQNELNEAKLRFFTNVSHEFRTPLSLTLGPIENLLRDKKNCDVKMRKQLELASRNAKLLMRLIDQVIDFRRLDAGKIKLKAAEQNIEKILKSVLNNFEPLFKEKEIEIFSTYSEEDINLWIDAQKIEQVLYNILSNAFKYVPREGAIAISLSRTDTIPNHPGLDGKWACISIYNDGKQIPEDDLRKVFERFYKVDNAQLGSGIGLAYSKSLVDLHKGYITAENTQVSGVTFNIYLRRGNGHLNEDEIALSAYTGSYMPDNAYEVKADLEAKAPVSYDHEFSLLVVEDNDELRDFFKMVLADKYDIYEAENGVKGLERAREVVPDVIITDLLMPEMNGFELCEALKDLDETSHIPIIMLTAVNTSEDMVRGYKVGADTYVTKPFEITVLEAQIERLISNRIRLQETIKGNGVASEDDEVILTREEHFLNQVKEIIDEGMSDPELNVNMLADKISLSSTQLYRKIKAVTGQSSVDFIKDYRLDRAAKLLRTTPASVKEVCYETGFKSPSYFVKCFKKRFGVTPREYSN
ncbi:response regulator [Bacteroidota bacterium]